jgi:iron complex transport system ATP-binding protein
MRLEAREISAGYGSDDVLHAIRLELGVGEFVGLIGPNGSGKSTLLRVLSRILPARKGSVLLDEKSLTAWSSLEIARRLAFVPQQEPALFEFTVRDVVLMGRYPYRTGYRTDAKRDWAVVERALIDADVRTLADRPITQLSGGEHRRVLLARALAQQTPFLLLDEPTAHLDVTHQVELMGLVRQLTCDRGVGALAALHDLNQAAEFCDRLILISAGRIIDQGSPERVICQDNLRHAYGAEAQIGRNPITDRPLILSIRSSRTLS